MKKMMFLSKNWYFSVQKALIYYTVNKSHHNSFNLLVFSYVANFRCVANFTFLTLHSKISVISLNSDHSNILLGILFGILSVGNFCEYLNKIYLEQEYAAKLEFKHGKFTNTWSNFIALFSC